MTPNQEPPAQRPVSGALAKPSRTERAAQIHSVRRHEFAMLRELINKGQGSTSGKVLAGLRSQAVRNKPPSAETLDKINAIEEQLEQLWRSKVTTVQSTLLGKTSNPPDAAADLAPQPLQALAQVPLGPTPTTQAPRSTNPWPPVSPSASPPRTAKPESPEQGVTLDPVLLAAARLFAQEDDIQAERVLLEALAQSQFPHTHARNWALALLDIYRTHAEPSRFDWAVLEFVQWWNAKTPQWKPAPAKAAVCKLQGRLQGPYALDLPEVDAAAQETHLAIDCTGLLGMDWAACKALRHWLRRAQARNHVVHLAGVNLMVAALWEQIGLAETAQWQLRSLP